MNSIHFDFIQNRFGFISDISFLNFLIYLIANYTLAVYMYICYLILSYLILSYLILSYLILSYLILSYLILSFLILSYIILLSVSTYVVRSGAITNFNWWVSVDKVFDGCSTGLNLKNFYNCTIIWQFLLTKMMF